MLDIEQFIQQATRDGVIPGVSLATLRDGERDITLSSGIRGAHDSSNVDAETVFEAASLAKPVVAYLVLQLVEQACWACTAHWPTYAVSTSPPIPGLGAYRLFTS